MNCPITVRLGVYALGAGDEAERVLIESHLATCQACQEELTLLEPLPGLLACVPVELIQTDSPPARLPGRVPVARITRAGKTRAGKVRTSAGRLRGAVSLAAAAALGAAGGFWLAQPGARPQAASSPPPAITLSGANPATHVRVTIRLVATSWGTSIQILAWGLPLSQRCELIVRSRTGGTEVAGAWDAWSTGPVNIPGSAAWLPQDISSLEVATPSRNLVTVSAVRPQAHVPPSSPLDR
jgi:hypothetical protein